MLPNDLNLNPEMVTLAREARSLNQSALARALEISQGHLSKMEAGFTPASESMVKRLSEVLRFPPAFFQQRARVYGPGVSEFYHRKRQDLSATLLRQAYAKLNIIIINLEKLLKAVDLGECNIPRLPRENYKSVEEMALAVRAIWNLPHGPVSNVVAAIENAGGIVIRCSFGTPKIDAISRWVPGLPPLFFVSDDIPADRERLTLCHELAHLVMHDAPVPEMEDEANRFAAEFLMPAKDIRHHFDRVSLPRLAELKPYWRVSMASLLYRAIQLGRVKEGSSRYLWMQMSQAGYKRREPPELDFPKEETFLLRDVFSLYLNQFGYSTAQLAEMLSLGEDNLEEFYRIQPGGSAARRMRLVK